MMKIVIGFFFALSLHGLEAEMFFKTKLIEVHAAADAKVVTTDFPFEIKGEDAEIISYDAPCSCLTAKVFPLKPDRSTKLKWSNGEKGKIVGRFEMGNFKGTIDKAVLIKLRGQKEPVQLIVRVHIPVLFAISPATHQWELNGPLTPKVFKIKVNHTKPINILKTMGVMQGFKYEQETIKPGQEYEVTVIPESTATPGMGRLAFLTDCEIPRHKRHQVFAVVKAPRK